MPIPLWIKDWLLEQKQSQKTVFVSLPVISMASFAGLANAEDWQINPSVSTTQYFTDNVDLAPSSDEDSAFITDFSPGLSIIGNGARYNLEMDYRMQNLLYSGTDKVNRTHQQFQTTSSSELIRNMLFMDIRSTHGQQNISSNGRVSSGNISGSSSNRTDVTTFSISPYWTPYLGGYVDGEVRFSYDTFSSDNLGGSSSNSSGASDSQTHKEIINLKSGTRYTKVTWFFDFVNDYTHRDNDGGNVQFRYYEGELRFHIDRDYAVFARSGRFDNQYASNTNSNANGTYKAVGFGWTPSKKLYLEALTGDEITEFSMSYNPSQRTSLNVSWRDRDVGTNVGEVWNLDFQHQTRRTSWSVEYSEDTVTSQSQFSDADILNNLVNDDGTLNVTVDPITGEFSTINLPDLVDEVFRRRNWTFSMNGRLARSSYNVRAYQEKRTYQVSDNDQEVQGISAGFNWHMMKRTQAYISGRYQKTDQDSSDTTDKRYEISLRLTRELGDTYGVTDLMQAYIEVRHLKQTSDDSGSEYDENRISASFIANF